MGCVCGNGFPSRAEYASLTASSLGPKDQRDLSPSNLWEGRGSVAAQQKDWAGLPGGGDLSGIRTLSPTPTPTPSLLTPGRASGQGDNFSQAMDR